MSSDLASEFSELSLGNSCRNGEDCFVCNENKDITWAVPALTKLKPNVNCFNEKTEINITTGLGEIPDLIDSFEVVNFPKSIFDNLKRLEHIKPTPVQKIAIPVLLDGRDFLACAQTGSGKTAAFLLPIFMKLIHWKETHTSYKGEPFAIIFVPSRELALQHKRTIDELTRNTSISTIAIYGGREKKMDVRKLNNGCDIVVGTPGRIRSLLGTEDKLGQLSFESLEMMIVDEADHMCDKNFEKIMESINFFKPASCQTAIFCANYPYLLIDQKQKSKGKDKKKLKVFDDCLKVILKDYVYANVGDVQGCPKVIYQEFCFLDGKKTKSDVLVDILKKESGNKIVVFVDTKKDTRSLSKYLCRLGFPVTVIHSDRSQQERHFALWQFNEGEKDIMISTSVSARGLDIYDLDIVINYDMPTSKYDSFATYKYRIGRSGRAGNRGRAISLMSTADTWLARALVVILAQSEQEVPGWLEKMCETENTFTNVTDLGAQQLALKQAAEFTSANAGEDRRQIKDQGRWIKLEVDRDSHVYLRK